MPPASREVLNTGSRYLGLGLTRRLRREAALANDLEGIMKNPLDCKVAFAGALLGAALISGPVLAQDATTAPQVQETQVAENTREPTVLVCKVFAVTGTRIVQEYCLTEEDWEDIRQQSRDTIERLMRTGSGV